MFDKRNIEVWSAMVVLLVIGLPVAYITGYFLRSKRVWTITGPIGSKSVPIRVYGTKWERIIYEPAAKLEAFATGLDVEVIYSPHPEWF